jgi:hypothetical protein
VRSAAAVAVRASARDGIEQMPPAQAQQFGEKD